eukprot:TRINITY_DN2892_c0_g1_i19.p2 TRINITY_DN2892_c0_g1~~TRINITY_DN2892_c0_g1_i19.p2  ORF type:complete len:122 (-),score=4.30 TRINITY_DN2892_c0_g1_i19:270-635(-)
MTARAGTMRCPPAMETHLLDLPREILHMIASCDELSNRDRANFAQACRELCTAVSCGDGSQLSAIDPSVNNNRAILSAARNGHLELCTVLLRDERVDPSAQDNRAIIEAARNGHSDIVNCC